MSLTNPDMFEINALRVMNERLKEQRTELGSNAKAWQDECARLQKELDALRAQEPVAWVLYEVGMQPKFAPVIAGKVIGKSDRHSPLYAAPQPSQPNYQGEGEKK